MTKEKPPVRGLKLRVRLFLVARELARVIKHATKALLAFQGIDGGYFLRRKLQLGGGEVFL